MTHICHFFFSVKISSLYPRLMYFIHSLKSEISKVPKTQIITLRLERIANAQNIYKMMIKINDPKNLFIS